jgi:UDP-glucose 4-epimerase
MCVSDLARAHVAALDWLAKGRPGGSINLGKGRGFSVAEVVQTTEKMTGKLLVRQSTRKVQGDKAYQRIWPRPSASKYRAEQSGDRSTEGPWTMS